MSLEFTIFEKKLKPALLFFSLLFCSLVYSQSKYTGMITNSNGTPLSQVKITTTDTTVSTFSDNEGKFSITTSDTLIVSKPGYISKRIVATSSPITLQLSLAVNNLDTVLVSQLSIPTEQRNAIDAVSYVDNVAIERGTTVALHPILNKVPGVFMQNATLNTNKIAIRGIGARNLFGTANIRAYFGDIPLTDGNGASAIEDLELGALAAIEIHKGPSASSYGVGLGGTILLHPLVAKSNNITAQSLFGSYGLRKFLTKATLANQKHNLTAIYSNTHSDGYRDNNTYDRNTLTLHSELSLGDHDKLSILGNIIALKGGIPSSLDIDDYTTNPRQAAFTWQQAQGFEDAKSGLLGLTHKHQYTTKLSHHTSVFSSFRNNYEPRPFNILEEKVFGFGIRSRLLGAFDIAKQPLEWTAGGELFSDRNLEATFQNLYQEFPEGTGSVRGNQLSDNKEQRLYYNIFAEAKYRFSNTLYLQLGMHLNQTSYTITDQFTADAIDNSGDFDFETIVSPKIGINYKVNNTLSLFGNIAHGFSPPTASETLLPDGVFNANIKPEIGWNYELGARYNSLNKKLSGTVSLYTMRVQDLLVTRRTVDDNFFAINAGKTIHNGIEFDIFYELLTLGQQAKLRLFSNGSIHNFTFDEFIDVDENFSDNELTGVPEHVLNAGIELISSKGFYGNMNLQNVGITPANDANTVFAEAYTLLHAKVGYTNTLGKDFNYNLFIGANNILDTAYASQLQINAVGFGDNLPRYFYPGLPFNVYGGLTIGYSL